MVYNCPHLYAPEDETGSTSGGGSTLDRFLASCARWGLRRPPSSSGSLAKLGCSRALQWWASSYGVGGPAGSVEAVFSSCVVLLSGSAMGKQI
ncbi:uncharacterized protein LOC120650926 isoform X5 [Panicum virgatum]|uniref:uncharacterized protein LOC120650926 isoform X5 n=1 Tax=Panicum virgatum TaxID=38727 RepID=UPI0019D5FCF2|nr:uncharacterized protein LOC120650926 isoform X5 [Panicum virgatum]